MTEVARTDHTPEEESDMGAKGEALARQFEVKAQESWAYVEKLGDADFKKVTEAEKWTVAATAHHLFGAYDRVPDIAKGLAAGRSPANFSTRMTSPGATRYCFPPVSIIACMQTSCLGAGTHGVRRNHWSKP